jgi:hypothetical protein
MHDKRPVIFYLSKPKDVVRERLGYQRAWAKMGIEVICIGSMGSISENIKKLDPDQELIGILHPEIWPGAPLDMWDQDIPSLCLQIDTESITNRRIRISRLFDGAVVFHPGYDEIFRKAGILQPILVPHAVEREQFNLPEMERIYDIGWVGSTGASIFGMRRKILPLLQARYKLNDPFRRYSMDEMAQVYCQSKIVVNISKDRYLEDANLRCFEAMAAGALLFTFMPSELTGFGFREGEHFIGFRNEKELIEKLDYYLNHDEERTALAAKTRALALAEHTYDNRARTLLEVFQTKKLLGEARQWSREERLLELIFWTARFGELDRPFRLMRQLPRGLWRLKAYFYIGWNFLSQTRYGFLTDKTDLW